MFIVLEQTIFRSMPASLWAIGLPEISTCLISGAGLGGVEQWP